MNLYVKKVKEKEGRKERRVKKERRTKERTEKWKEKKEGKRKSELNMIQWQFRGLTQNKTPVWFHTELLITQKRTQTFSDGPQVLIESSRTVVWPGEQWSLHLRWVPPPWNRSALVRSGGVRPAGLHFRTIPLSFQQCRGQSKNPQPVRASPQGQRSYIRGPFLSL